MSSIMDARKNGDPETGAPVKHVVHAHALQRDIYGIWRLCMYDAEICVKGRLEHERVSCVSGWGGMGM
jgi:hypothetical protein